MSEKTRILICGGGNGAHCLTVLAEKNLKCDVHVLTLFQDEAERWNAALNGSGIKLTIIDPDKSHKEYFSKPRLITKDVTDAMEGVQIIFFILPAFGHAQYINAMSEHLQPNTLIVGLPGQPGFEFQCKALLGAKANGCSIVSLESLPWACRIAEFGKHVQILGYKQTLGISVLPGKDCTIPFPIIETIQKILGEKPKLEVIQNYIAINLMAKSMVHPPMIYGKWGDWDGKPLTEEPLFYQGIDEKQASLLSTVSDELISAGKKLEELRKDVDMSQVLHIFDWYKTYYGDQITDMSNLMMAMRTNKAYDGLVHPMIKSDDGYVPNFLHRYTSEDIPLLVVIKGIAEIAGVDTPVMDEIITWGQAKLGKEYIVGTKLVGKDIGSARAPQSFGICTVDGLFDV